jgi:penicillin-binding protein 1A
MLCHIKIMRFLWYMTLALFSIGMLGLIASIGGAVYAISYYGKDLPDYTQLKDYSPPVVTRVYAGDGRLMAEFAQEKRVFVPIESVPPLVKQAFIAAEDKNFYKHDGVDYLAILRAAISNVKKMGSGKRPEGASTITQQVAKNFLLTNEVSYKRKIREAILAFRMERAMSKDRLLELYLNEIYLGRGAYGVAAASLKYFNKSLEELEIHELAYLAALPKAPNNYHPIRNHDAALARRNWVIGRMVEDTYIHSAQGDLAKSAPLTMVEGKENIVSAPYFAEEIRRFLINQYGEDILYGGGLAVRTTLDPKLQQYAVESLRNGLVEYDKRHGYRGPVARLDSIIDWKAELEKLSVPGKPDAWKLAVVLNVNSQRAAVGFKDGTEGELLLKYLSWARKHIDSKHLGDPISSVSQVLSKGDVVLIDQVEADGQMVYGLRQIPDINGAIIALDPHTGRILAMHGGWSHEQSEFNRAFQAKRQPGSAFKPFVYLAALDKGFTPGTLVLDAPFCMDQGPGLGKWCPDNYTKEFYGPTPIRVGIEKSRNLMTVRLADFVGMEDITTYARKFGVIDDMEPLLANALGAAETTLLQLTTGYAQLVNGGKKISPTLIDRIQDRRGKTVLIHDKRQCQKCGTLIKWDEQETPLLPDIREQIADPRKAYQVVSMMEGVVKRGTGIRINALGKPLAGKTGTTNESRDTWFIGFSPDLVVGVFAGFDEPATLGRKETGSSIAVPIFKSFMEEALKDTPARPFRVPPGVRNVQINAETGARAKPGDERIIWEAFLTGTEPTDTMYILDGNGISRVQGGTPGVQGSALTGTGGIY